MITQFACKYGQKVFEFRPRDLLLRGLNSVRVDECREVWRSNEQSL